MQLQSFVVGPAGIGLLFLTKLGLSKKNKGSSDHGIILAIFNFFGIILSKIGSIVFKNSRY